MLAKRPMTLKKLVVQNLNKKIRNDNRRKKDHMSLPKYTIFTHLRGVKQQKTG